MGGIFGRAIHARSETVPLRGASARPDHIELDAYAQACMSDYLQWRRLIPADTVPCTQFVTQVRYRVPQPHPKDMSMSNAEFEYHSEIMTCIDLTREVDGCAFCRQELGPTRFIVYECGCVRCISYRRILLRLVQICCTRCVRRQIDPRTVKELAGTISACTCHGVLTCDEPSPFQCEVHTLNPVTTLVPIFSSSCDICWGEKFNKATALKCGEWIHSTSHIC